MKYRAYHPLVRGVHRWALKITGGPKVRRLFEHPETGRPFRSRAEVDRCIDEIRGQNVHHNGATVRQVAKTMFSPSSPWAQRQARRRDGRDLSPHTIAEHELNARLHILDAIGDLPISAIDTQSIDQLLYSLEMTNRGRRGVAGTIMAILKEALYRRITTTLPRIELPEKKSRKPSVLTLEELRQLFPTGRRALLKLWGGAESHPETPGASLALAGCAAVMFWGGLRPQEARAVHLDQLIRRLSVLLVTRSMDGEGNCREYLKMADARDPRYRGTFLVDRAMEVLDEMGKPPGPFLFAYRDRPIRPELLNARVKSAAERAGILSEGRRLISYSGRYTFDTTVRPILPREILMLLMGHVDQAMPERYDVPVLVERMKQLGQYRVKMNKALGG